MSTRPNYALSIIAIALLVSLAGCGAISAVTGPSITGTNTTVIEERPALTVEYETDDYATLLLEDPDGEVVYETRIEPETNSTALFFSEPRPGEYTVVLRQGGETVTSKSITYEGAEVKIESVEQDWFKNKLRSVEVRINNTGDLPLRIGEGAYSVKGYETSTDFYETVGAGETTTIEVKPSYLGEVKITKPGDVDGELTIQTTAGDVTKELPKTFEPASLSITQTNPTWEGSELVAVEVKVRNNGDVPTTGNATIEHGGEVIAYSGEEEIPPGETVSFTVDPYGSIFEADSGGSVEFETVVNSPSGYVSEGFTREIDAATVTIESMSPTWENGQLTELTFTASNDGEVAAEYPVRVTVNGETVFEATVNVPAGDTYEYTAFDVASYAAPKYIAESGGEYEVKVTIETDDGPVSKSDVVEFDGVDSSISGVDATFYESFESDGFELSSLSFSLRNEGDLPILFDAIEVSIGGATRTETMYTESSLLPGESTNQFLTLTEEIVVDSGTQELTIRLKRDGETVVSETVTVSTG